MSPFPWHYLAALFALIVLNGVFAMSELAIVSAKSARLRMAAERGSRNAQVALKLAAEPGKFLSTVQIGITLIGIINGAVSGATLGGPVGERVALLGVAPDTADDIGVVIVIVITTYLSLVVGELVPKQLALRAAEPIAIVVARPMLWLAAITAPFVWLLDTSSGALMRLLGIRHRGEHGITVEELRMILSDATRSGVIEEEERAILAGIMRLGQRPVRELMTPRTELDWIDRGGGEEELCATLAATPHSLLPVADGSVDRMLGVIKVKEVLAMQLAGGPLELDGLIRKAEVLPDQLDAMDALRVLQQSDVGMAMVHDEYGHLEGVVTPADLLRAIAGSFASHQDEGDEPDVVERSDGTLLIAGAMAADALAERLALDLPPDREFATAAGYALWVLKKLPAEGEAFAEQGWRFEVVDMDGRRIDKLLVSQL
jgi:putative hemolysin